MDINKEEFIVAILDELDEMMFSEPKCTYEHIYNQSIHDVKENIQTFRK